MLRREPADRQHLLADLTGDGQGADIALCEPADLLLEGAERLERQQRDELEAEGGRQADGAGGLLDVECHGDEAVFRQRVPARGHAHEGVLRGGGIMGGWD